MQTLKDGNEKEQSAKMTQALLSKHNGWITVDANNLRRSEATEIFQPTNPEQRNKMRPNWMETKFYSSLDVERYKKCALSQQKTNHDILTGKCDISKD